MSDDSSTIDPPMEVDVSETTENYLKRILILTNLSGQARMSDIAKSMGRSLSSTSEAVKRMAQEGFLDYEKYGKITLTNKGLEIASHVHENYETINQLLQVLGIPEHVALLDACSMEHSVSETTMSTIAKFIEFAQNNNEGKDLINRFQEFVNKK